MMRRVVVTGLGIVSSIGNTKDEVLRSLREGASGIEFVPEMEQLGYRCHVAGRVNDFDYKRDFEKLKEKNESDQTSRATKPAKKRKKKTARSSKKKP